MATKPAEKHAAPIRRPRGRPRDPRVEGVVLSATRELLLAKGFGGLTIAAVAEEAGVGKGTIYLRWPDKEALVISALREVWEPAATPDTGTLRGDLLAIMTDAVAGINGTPGALLVSLLGELGAHEGLRALYDDLVVRPWDKSLSRALKRGEKRGELRAGLDARVSADCFWGPLLSTRVLRGRKVPSRQVGKMVDLFLMGVGR